MCAHEKERKCTVWNDSVKSTFDPHDTLVSSLTEDLLGEETDGQSSLNDFFFRDQLITHLLMLWLSRRLEEKRREDEDQSEKRNDRCSLVDARRKEVTKERMMKR